MASPHTKIKAIFFDFMGTCLDWHTSVVQSWPQSIPIEDASKLTLEWRRQYFIENERRFRQGLHPEDIDITLVRVLEEMLSHYVGYVSILDTGSKRRMVESWHSQTAWPEVQEAIRIIREGLDLEVFVHANGTTRLQLDLKRSSGLEFDMLFSSQILGLYKPSPDAYKKALEFVRLQPEEVVMVAAHAYDLRAAQECGMRTVYIHRWTDDIDEEMNKVEHEFDVFLEDMRSLPRVVAEMGRSK